MRKFIAVLLLLTNVLYAQKNTDKVWDLLLQNKRTEARTLFDKSFGKIKNDNLDLVLLDAILDQEMGQLMFDTDFLERFSKFPESKYLLYPIWYYKFGVGDVEDEGFDDYSFKKMDFIADNELYKNDLLVKYFKAFFDRRRRRYDEYNKQIATLNQIKKWQFCGVFENINDSGLDIDYGPETYANNDKTFNANSNGIVNWYNPKIPQNEGCHYYTNEAEYASGIIYAQTFLENPAAREVVLHFGSEGPLKIFLNDVEIYSNKNIKESDLNAYELKFNMPKGMNRLLFKSSLKTYKDYLFAALRDVNGNTLDDITYFDSYKKYNLSNLKDINPIELSPKFEQYLKEKVNKEPFNPLYTLLLFDAYNNNHKNEKAYRAIKDLYNKYPSSSLLISKMAQYYSNIENYDKVAELQKNMQLNDKYYFKSIALKCNDESFLQSANIKELEDYRDNAKNMMSRHLELLLNIMISLRNSNIDEVFENVNVLLEESHHNDKYTRIFSKFYTSLKNDREKSISMLEELLDKNNDPEAKNALIDYYNAANRKDDVKKLVQSEIDIFPYINFIYADAINIANNENNYDQAIKYIGIALENFPYSYSLLEKMGRAYSAMKNTKEAEKYFKKSLLYNSSNSELRKTLYDIKRIPDEIEAVATNNIYELIKEKRTIEDKMYCDYGINMLLDEYIINVFPEGGQKSRITYAYEIIAENGIEELKEYSININGVNILKSEIVKPDGTLVPGDHNNGSIVFTNLKVGDVVLIQYETSYNSTGRFYKDFNFMYYFNGVYPSLKNYFGIIYPDGTEFSYNVFNGDLKPKTKKINSRNFMFWEQVNVPSLVLHEDYTKEYSDLVTKISISSIKSWTDIANWYADLVQKNIKLENEALEAYNTIFPQGTATLNEKEIAFKIYQYIEENITYSSVDFRQSGYVPQKPSKTISSRLGDCKDLSTLFVAMAERAGLSVNLVLVQTNDNGTDWLKIPSLNFNHCIVQVKINGEDQFLEMTDNYLPYGALGSSLYNANALVVNFDKELNKNIQLTKVKSIKGFDNRVLTKTIINVALNHKEFKVAHKLSGNLKSYYNELFGSGYTEDLRKKEIEDNFNGWLNKVVSLKETKLLPNNRFENEIAYEATFTVNENLQSVGSLSIMEIPYIFKAYTKDIITENTRQYEINYPSYESVKQYETEFIINIPEDRQFTELPQDCILNFRDHHYELSFSLPSPNSLKLVRKVSVPWDNISTDDYPEYKKYVEQVITAEENIIGFK